MDRQPERPSMALRRLVNGYQATQAIGVAARLGIADLLAAGPRASEDLAVATGAHSGALYRLLRALASIGVLHEAAERRFSLTPIGECLRADAPEPVAGWAAFVCEPYYRQAWDALEQSVRTGENAFRLVHGEDPWTYRQRHPATNAVFNRAMTDRSRQVSAAVLEAFAFGRYASVVDVGGGAGAFLAAILVRYPAMRGVLFDQPHVAASAAPILAAAGVADRCEVASGSFFAGVPAGADAYLLKSILHDWDDERCGDILRTCRRAMAPGAALLVVEQALGSPNENPDAKFSDLNMLVAP
ncbi:MAG TPA: methyltransferase, partial [Thermomicrobiales bacterium]|nr:methyltransferase [Thermomicrobiales bacterium]